MCNLIIVSKLVYFSFENLTTKFTIDLCVKCLYIRIVSFIGDSFVRSYVLVLNRKVHNLWVVKELFALMLSSISQKNVTFLKNILDFD